MTDKKRINFKILRKFYLKNTPLLCHLPCCPDSPFNNTFYYSSYDIADNF